MNKVGIITFHASNNCGSMLQAYGLQKTLDNLGFKNEIIDFSNPAQQHLYAFLRKPLNFHDIVYDAGTLLYYKLFKTHYTDYKCFINDNLCVSKNKYSTSQELESICSEYESFVTGSDQVWNICCPDADDAYYLNFVQGKKKIAYAPSFGATNLLTKSEVKDKYRTLLAGFDAISIRENNGAKWIKELIGQDVPVLIDPTMFLNKKDYECMADEIQIPKQKYIFYYAFKYSDSVNGTVKKISEQYNMPVYILDAKSWVKTAKKWGFKVTEHSGPKTFVKYLFGAELVLTTSFHGTVFSIIGRKKFWFINSSMHNVDDDRAGTLLDMFDLNDRMQSGENILNGEIMKQPDFAELESKLEQRRTEAKNFLIEALSRME